uniref:Uncharacterized protein n=1 Tax=Tanacetum cinerariifolium TaxID=118510 RepID=A0A6L2JZA2_TANCI|nr:hypothetical protein [Tanacetum cinerariifolium]
MTNQAAEIEKLKNRLKKLEGKKKKTYGLKRMYKGRMNEKYLFGVNDLDGDEVIVDVTAGKNVEQDATVAEKKDDVTLAQTLIEIKVAKPRARGVIFQEPSEFKTTPSSQTSQLPQAKDKEKERIARDKDEANIAVIEEWDDVQATIDAGKQLAEQLQAQKREHLSIEEKSKLLAELIESRRKYFAAKRADEIRNKPPTKGQQKSLMCTYMKNMKGKSSDTT